LNEIEKKEENVALQWLEGNYLELEKLIKGKEEVPQPESSLKRLSKKFSNLKGG